ncbi:uncharacterized protein CC84DRAFT_1204976 [Paraphaeosphaeria sporulosa]|uniref:Fungal-specific transcription factor domain-containing protein n=1 Tax=Paraphaeosphaeria sporulosa TaxID=1460663 RepID=A0A177CJ35_9PLEO|nr:uncharacterized protein CC84DRAFT_1204976 [Paraphaeosphaeria sporulosa]OAG07513.1 hypothetical protein CC84DRAFT_1204976 [Paraphaeosphaeria sporulosa]
MSQSGGFSTASGHTNNTATSVTVGHLQQLHLPSSALQDASIIASLLLLGPEIINAGHKQGPAQVRWLLRGARSLIVERHKYFSCLCPLDHPARYEPQFSLDSPVLVSSVRSLVFTDIITCVPCVRRPYIGKQYWLDSAIQTTIEGLRTYTPDPDLGYSAWTLALLGDCATLIEELYTNAISQEAFSVRQATLLGQLEDTVKELEQHDNDGENQMLAVATADGRNVMAAHRRNIAATICHSRAAQIFLHRSTNFDVKSTHVQRLRQALYDSISTIPMEDSAATTVLWPLWVLGCETYPGMNCPSQVEMMAMLQRLYDSQCMRNVKQCLDRLTRDIWRQDHSNLLNMKYKYLKPDDQSAWVRRCWDEKLELLLA